MSRFSAEALAGLQALRQDLHRRPELSGEEAQTAALISRRLQEIGADEVVTGLGGHGVAGIWQSAAEGPTVLLRCELDALPIEEISSAPYRSEIPGKGHLCGHDGHMATLIGVAQWLSAHRPARGRAVLLFQPAEEDGSGAAKVLSDPAFTALRPDVSYALHNMPGLPFGTAALCEGLMNCASRGQVIRLTGRTAHASAPEEGVSPMAALAELMPALTALSAGDHPREPGFTRVTVTHAAMGAPSFGVAPGAGEIWATLRTRRDAEMDRLVAEVARRAQQAADAAGLTLEITTHDVFAHCENAPEAVATLDAALTAEGLPRQDDFLPMRASEDFGRFGHVAPSAMVLLGAGEDRPALHNPDYDFDDRLIAIGAGIFIRLLEHHLTP